MIGQIKTLSALAAKDNASIMSNVLIKDGYAQCQDMMCGAALKVDTDIEFCCNIKKLKTILSSCDPDDIKMSIKKDKLTIKSGKFKSTMRVIPADQYPQVKNSTNYSSIEIESDILSSLKSVSLFSNPDDVRQFIQGVEISKNKLSATNGHMAIIKDINIDTDNSSIIPSKSIDKLYSMKLTPTGISVNDNFTYFEFDNGYFFSTNISAKMPDISKMIKDINKKTSLHDLKEPVTIIRSLCDNFPIVELGKEIKTPDGTSSISGFDYPDVVFNADYLLLIINCAEYIDFSYYPEICPFEGQGIKGAIIGIRL